MFTEIEVTEVEPIEPPVDAILGDANGDGNIDMYDYILVKRQIMGTIELTDDQLAVSDIDGDEDVDMYDYILIKRHILGTYVIG